MEDNKRIFPDDKLISMFRNGDSRAFETLLSRYDEYIMKAIRRSTINNNDSVEDLYQEIVTHLYEKLKCVYKANGHFGAWLNCVVGNFLCSVYRKKHQECLPLKLDILKDDDCLVDNYVSAEKREQKFDDLEKAVRSLPEELNRLVKMKIWEGLTYQEISDQTGINKSTVVKRLKSAYLELEKRMLAKGYDDALI
ncbi:MAG TPA: sigma-70 family RNA polymerase sigma factor [Phocaeicola coprocola]|uniref:Sigma-70 family RNA polymerase sigma factor n=1 Tax=Phocaeicola coprocola TaxID=310298 RepID=A0A921FEH3_9BACT|nr:sigma-70 family RNA polymerase sigma factor [Phocaeicola coprocola]